MKARDFAKLVEHYGIAGTFLGEVEGRLAFEFFKPSNPTTRVTLSLGPRDLDCTVAQAELRYIMPISRQFENKDRQCGIRRIDSPAVSERRENRD